MSWQCRHHGKIYEVQDGADFVIDEQVSRAGGYQRLITTTYCQDGTRHSHSQDYPVDKYQPAIGWTDEKDSCLSNAVDPRLEQPYTGINHAGEAFGRVGQAMGEATVGSPRMGKATHEKLDEEPEMKNSYPSGLRVSFRQRSGSHVQLGTVVNTVREYPLPTVREYPLPKGTALICSDDPIPAKMARPGTSNLDIYTGRGYAAVVNRRYISPLPDQTSGETYATLPEHIGVVIKGDGGVVDNVRFKHGTLGRLVYFTNGRAVVSWYHARDDNFYISRPFIDPRTGTGKKYPNCYAIPTSILQWCCLDDDQMVAALWPESGRVNIPEFNIGDYVVYTSSKSTPIAGADRHYGVIKGAILQITASSGNVSYSASLVSGCDKRVVSLQVRLDGSRLAPLGFPYIEAGKQVEVVASVEFKKQELRGQRGVVVLPTDADGDVGVQFGEDIGAGSLDGAGKSRHCLYVPASAIQKISG